MRKEISVFLAALLLTASMAGCGSNKDTPSPAEPSASESSEETGNSDKNADTPDAGSDAEEEPTEATTVHVSPVETLSSSYGVQQTIKTSISRNEGSNTIKLPLSDFIEEGDIINSFTFVIYSDDNNNIGEFKGGCGISVTNEYKSTDTEGWYKAPDFTAPTQGTYGEITWNVPADVSPYVTAGGEVLFGYWWGGATKIRVQEVICNITRTREIPVDDTQHIDIGSVVNYGSTDNKFRIPTADILPDDGVPQAVTFNLSAAGSLTKFTGAFGYESSKGSCQTKDIAVFTNGNSLSLTWLVNDEAKSYIDKDGELVLGYWWSNIADITLDSVDIKYSTGGASAPSKPIVRNKNTNANNSSGFRSSTEIVKDIKVGWNLGNTLDSYNTGKSGLETEIGWGNPTTTEEMIKGVKNAGFNAIRIPVTWDEHIYDGAISNEWLNRVKDVVDYAYNNDMYVILNMHHDDYIWFNPTEAEYAGDSEKLKKIWQQIAETFKGYDDHLIFEGMNEPRSVGSAAEWLGGTAAERAIINKYEQDFVDTVRASGGNNADRTLIITSYAASAEDSAVNDITIPDDSNIIVSLHYYAPWRFADGQITTFGDSEKSELDAKFAKIKSKFIDKGIPVIIGEFGCVAKADDAVRADYYNYYIASAKANGIKCFVWDNGVATGTGAYGLYNRRSCSWNDTILAGIMKGAE